MNYVEEFSINDEMKYLISKNDGPRQSSVPTFTPWFWGSAIHPAFNTIGECRQFVFDHAKQEIKYRIAGIDKRKKMLEASDTRLGSDSFNLAKFKLDADAIDRLTK